MKDTAENVVTQIGSLPTEILVLTAVFVVLFFVILSRGKKQFIAAVIAFYPAMMLYLHFPYNDLLPGGEEPTTGYGIRLIMFAAFFVLSFLGCKYFVRKKINATGGKKGLQSALLSLSLVSLLASVMVVIIPIDGIYQLSDITGQVLKEKTVFWWLLAPLAILFISKK